MHACVLHVYVCLHVQCCGIDVAESGNMYVLYIYMYVYIQIRDVPIIGSVTISADDMLFFTISVIGTACTGSRYKY